MPIPVQLATTHHDGQGPNLLYHVEGELVPVLRLQLGGSVPAYFEHHVLLWKEPTVDVQLKPIKGAFKRFIAGMPIFLTQAVGQGHIAFSRDGTGQIIPMHLQPGQSIEVREHQFLAATDNVAYTFTRVRGIANMLFGSTTASRLSNTRASSSCTATATSSRSPWERGRRSTSSRAAGSTRTSRSGWRSR